MTKYSRKIAQARPTAAVDLLGFNGLLR